MGAGGSSHTGREVAAGLTAVGGIKSHASPAALHPQAAGSITGPPSNKAAAPAATNAMQGAAVPYTTGDTLRVVTRTLKKGEALSQDVGRVMEGALVNGNGIPPPPLEAPKEGTVFGWFVEDLDRPGAWEPYSKESADRLEDAFLHSRPTCTVVMKKRSYMVSLQSMQQLPVVSAGAPGATPGAQQQQQRMRDVKRVPVIVYTDAATGEVKTREAPPAMVDPFAEEEAADEAAGGGSAARLSIAEGAGDVVGSAAGSAAAEAAEGYGPLPHLVRTVVPHTCPIYTMECTPEVTQLCAEARAVIDPAGGALVLSSGHDLQLLEWSVASSTVVTRYEVPRTTSKNSFLTANYSATARWVVAGLDDCTARLYAIGKPDEIYRLEGHTHKVYGAGVLAGDTRAATASMDCRVKLWDIATGACVHTVVPHKSHIFALRPHPTDPNFALTAGEDHVVCMHDFRQENSVAAVFTGHDRTVWDMDWNPADVTFASCGMDCTTRVFDPRVCTTALHTLRSHSRAVHSLKYTPRGRGLLSCSKDFLVDLADTTNWSVQWQAKAHAATVFRVRCHAGASVLVTAASDSSVNIWRWNGLAQL